MEKNKCLLMESAEKILEDAEVVECNEDIDARTDEECPVEKDLEQAKMQKELGNTAFKNGDFEGAIALYSKAIDFCPCEESAEMVCLYRYYLSGLIMYRQLTWAIDPRVILR